MALLMEHQFREVLEDQQVDTESFLEAVSHLPPFFGRVLFCPAACHTDGKGESRSIAVSFTYG